MKSDLRSLGVVAATAHAVAPDVSVAHGFCNEAGVRLRIGTERAPDVLLRQDEYAKELADVTVSYEGNSPPSAVFGAGRGQLSAIPAPGTGRSECHRARLVKSTRSASIFGNPESPAMLLSRTCEYGVRAMVFLAAESPDDFTSVRAISDELNISFHFLTKIFQQLSRAGLLQSYRGPNGGVRLSRPASEITLKEVVLAIEGPDLFTECVLGLPGCGDRRPCPLHDSWYLVRSEISRMLEGRRLDEIGREVVRGHLRLSGD